MRIIRHYSVDPYFNLAAEEYLMDNEPRDVFMVWRNDRSVIVGRNQNTWAEVDTEYTRSAGIAVVRRLTGGGAVFHDLGNVNFTFITGAEGGIDFPRFAAPILRMLSGYGIDARLGGRNDILAGDGVKISGCAACVRRTPVGERRMHHGTLLFGADLSEMASALTPSRDKLASKGIASVRSRVGNIRDLSEKLAGTDAEGFADSVAAFAAGEYDSPVTDLGEDERTGIAALASVKYTTWEWNFGQSPEFAVTRRRRFPFGAVEISFTADRGAIRDIAFSGDFFSESPTEELSSALCGEKLNTESLRTALRDVGKYILGASPEQISDLITGNGTE